MASALDESRRADAKNGVPTLGFGQNSTVRGGSVKLAKVAVASLK